MDGAIFVSQLFNGLSSASILLLMALGLAIIFGLMGVINMAHGEIMTAGAYTAYIVEGAVTHWAPALSTYAFLAALPLSFLVAAVLGLIVELTVIRHLYGRPLETLLATWGVSLIMQQGFRSIFGSNNVSVTTPTWLRSAWHVTTNLDLPYVRIFILVFAAVVVGGVFAYLYRTRSGLEIRAVMQNRDMAACLGVATRKIDALTFALGCGLAGLAGCALALIGPIGPTTGQAYIVDSFMVVVTGGVGKVIGAVVGAFAIGELQSTFEFFTSATAGKVLIFVLIIIFLNIRPAGIFPSRSRSLD
ncbi:MAG TPA: urea ABC transporter permease subunit UrtB [Acidiferrobacter sp.]|nr:urea ABC transporter permease subunit UrtB [Acidiferrobacter sp.]